MYTFSLAYDLRTNFEQRRNTCVHSLVHIHVPSTICVSARIMLNVPSAGVLLGSNEEHDVWPSGVECSGASRIATACPNSSLLMELPLRSVHEIKRWRFWGDNLDR